MVGFGWECEVTSEVVRSCDFRGGCRGTGLVGWVVEVLDPEGGAGGGSESSSASRFDGLGRG